MKQLAVLLLCGALAASASRATGGSSQVHRLAGSAGSLSDFRLHLEVDLADLSTELVLESESEQPLMQVSLYDMAGTQLFDLNPASFAGIGVSEFAMEADGIPLAQALAIYPEGRYLVQGRTISGALTRASVLLSHRFPGPFHVLPIESGGTCEGVTVSWTQSLGAERYLLEIENDELGESFEFTLGAHRNSVTLPHGLLVQGSTYEVSLVAQGDNDNEIEVETAFEAK